MQPASVAVVVASLGADPGTPRPQPTATLLVATDPSLVSGSGSPGESLLLGAAPAPTAPLATSPTTTDAIERVGWMRDVGTWGTPLLVGGALLLALTGPAGVRRLTRRRADG